jgi:uncharacterized protein YecT (DUF1311 family)
LLTVFAAPPVQAAATAYGNDDWKKECVRVKDLPIPAADQPSAEALKALAKCEAQDLYYDARNNAGWIRARHCAIAQNEPTTLMMLYANGRGVSRNYDLAIKFACAADGAPAEMSGRIEHLLELKRSGGGKTDFDQCDDITSGYMMGVCAAIGERYNGQRRDARLKALVTKWPPEHRAALTKLQKFFDEFVKLASDHEVDQSGTARGAFVIEAEAAHRDDLLKMLDAFERGKLPAQGAAELQALDRRLNDAYKRIMGAKLEQGAFPGTVTQAGIRDTQRAWLKYRDAWVEFGRVRYPAVPEAAWRALLTGQRVEALKTLEEELPKQ